MGGGLGLFEDKKKIYISSLSARSKFAISPLTNYFPRTPIMKR